MIRCAFSTVLLLVPIFLNATTLETRQMKLGGKTITVEIADTEESRAQGLMYRKSLKPDHGMLFVFENEMPRSFWMKNTFIPLSIGFFDRAKKLLVVLDMEPVQSVLEKNLKTYSSQVPAMYALEMERGWFQKNKIKPGNVTFELLPERQK